MIHLPSLIKRHQPDVYLLSALLISLLIAAFVQRDAFMNPLAVNDDVRNQIYWLARLVDPNLFPHDFIADYFTQSSLISPVLWLIYGLAGLFIDPVRAGQFMPLVLAPLTTYFVYRFGAGYAGQRYGFYAAFAFNLMIWLNRNMAGGLARSFAYPLLFAFLLSLSQRNRLGLLISTWLAALIYPPVLFLCAGIWIVSLLFPPKSQNDSTASNVATKPDKMSFLYSIGGGLAILVFRFVLVPANLLFGALTDSNRAAQTPEFYQGGRVPLFHFYKHPINLSGLSDFMAEIAARTPGLNRTIPLLALLLAYWLFQRFIAPKLGNLKVPPLAWRCLGAAIALYILAWQILFYLYVPERYLQLSIPVIYIFLLAGLLEVLATQVSRVSLTPKAKTALLLLPLAISTFVCSLLWDENLIEPDPQMVNICNYLRHTPKRTLVATTPGIASDIPLCARRSVLISNEAYIPFHQTYFNTMKTRLQDTLVAYYSTTPEPVMQFIRKYNVDYLLVNTEDFTLKALRTLNKRYYHSFPNPFYRQLVQDRQEQDFVLTHPKASCRVAEVGPFILIPGKAILSGNCLQDSPSVSSTPRLEHNSR